MPEARPTEAMWTMAVDAVTSEVLEAFSRDGVGALLLKGPTIADWLYADGSRGYVDTDLLVDPRQVGAAQRILDQLGFVCEFGPLPHPGMEAPPAAPWRRGRFLVDLHETLPGASAQRTEVWHRLSSEQVEHMVAGRPVAALSPPARLAHLSMHAAHHGPAIERPLADLRMAVRRTDLPTWAQAAEVAESIGATESFVTGLSLLSEGCELLQALGRKAQPSMASALRAANVPLAAGVGRVGLADGAGEKARLLVRELFPSRAFMRWSSPLARGSRLGLVLAYPKRWAYLAKNLPRALWTYNGVRRRLGTKR